MSSRIAYVNQDPGIRPDLKNGAAVHVTSVRNALGSLGAEVVAVDSPGDRESLATLEAAHRRRPFDLVYERYALNAFSGSAFARRARVPHVLEVNSPLSEEASIRPVERVNRRAQRAMFRRASCVVAVSTEVARYAIERGAEPERVFVRPNAVDPDVFQPQSEDDGDRARYVPAGRFALGYHGRLRPWHNFGLFVAAAQDLLERGVEVQVVMLGEGAFLSHVEARLPPDRCTFVAWKPQEEAARVVACFDAVPITYSRAGSAHYSPLRLLEAMAAGVPPVAPSLGDLPQDVRDGETGLLYEPDDRAALVEALESLARDRALARRLADGARRHATTRTWEGHAREILALAGSGVPTRG